MLTIGMQDKRPAEVTKWLESASDCERSNFYADEELLCLKKQAEANEKYQNTLSSQVSVTPPGYDLFNF